MVYCRYKIQNLPHIGEYIMKKALVLFLTILTVLQCLPLTVFAETGTVPGAPAVQPNVWKGDSVKYEVKAGTGSYTCLSYLGHSYEITNHMVYPPGTTGKHKIPQLLIMVDAAKDYTWTPDGLYSFGASNYEVMYCCDIKTGYDHGIYYRRVNLDDSTYYDRNRANHIRGILTNSYPYITLEQMKSNLEGIIPDADKLTRSDIITAVQTAVWAFANGGEDDLFDDYVYYRTYDVPSNLQWGDVMHDFTNEMQPIWWKTGKRVYTEPKNNENAKAAGERIDALIAYLKTVAPREAPADQVVISGMEILDSAPVIENGNIYTTVIRVKLNSSGSGKNDNLGLSIYVGDQLVQSKPIEYGNAVYDFVVRAAAGQTIRAAASGKQILPTGVYFYDPLGGRDVSQSLVGVSGGPTDVYAEAEVTLNVDPVPVKADIHLAKVGIGGAPLAGAGFELYVTSTTIPTLIGSYRVDASGKLTIEGLLPGTYELTETVVPAGYLDPMAPIRFTVDAAGAVILHQSSNASYADGTLIVRNDPITTSVSGRKIWDDNNNQDGIRPDSITVNLLADGVVVKSASVSAADGWSWTFTDLPKYNRTGEIKYTVTEEPVSGYTSSVTGHSITNTHKPVLISIPVTKTWNDDNNRDNLRPASITVNLLADGVVVKSATLTAANGWSHVFTDLPKLNAGREIRYTVTENPVPGYTTEISGFNIINSHNPTAISIPVTKTWNDDNNRDNLRPASITVNLLADGVVVKSATLTAANGWSHLFTDLPKLNAGKEIRYTVTENPVPGYTTEISGFNIINSHNPTAISIPVTKTWNDDNNRDNLRPASITVNLLADGVVVKSATLTAANGWSHVFTDLPKLNAGKEIRYTVTENPVPGYTTEISGFNIINSHNPTAISIPVTKTWNDDNNRDNLRPASVTVHLLADGVVVNTVVLSSANGWTHTFTNLLKMKEGREIRYTLSEEPVAGYTAAYNGYNIINTHNPAKTGISVQKVWSDGGNFANNRPASITVHLLADGVRTGMKVTLSAQNNWSAVFSNLEYYRDGVQIRYTVEEEVPAGYMSFVSGTAETGFTITNVPHVDRINIPVAKFWDDNNNAAGVRPASVTVALYANGMDTKRRATLSEKNNWSATFSGMPVQVNGFFFNYTVKEVPVDGYVSHVIGSASGGYIIVNTYTPPEKTFVSGVKFWNDSDNRDGIRPESITVHLLADGAVVQSKTVTAADDWSWNFSDLPATRQGRTIRYTVAEDPIPGYTSAVNGYNITNTHIPEKISIPVRKVWADADNKDGLRPASVVISLLADGKKTGRQITLSAQNGWSGSFTDLDKCLGGKEIRYTVEEAVPAGYESSVTGSAESGYTVTNIHNPPKKITKISVSVTKSWQDANNRDGIRPASITVKLYADGKDTGRTAQLSAASGWSASFTDLDETKDGKKIAYTVAEVTPDGYTSTVTGSAADGFHITNTHDPEKVRISGSKIWEDNNNRAGKRPASISVHLWADDKLVETKRVSAADGWAWSFSEMNAFENGKRIHYRVTESAVDGYITSYNGWNIVNTLEEEKLISIPVSKRWVDLDNALGTRPASITVELLANGKSTGISVTLGAAGGWSSSFDKLPIFDENGKRITYSVAEQSVESYTAEISGNAESGFAIVNTYEELLDDEEIPLSPPTGDAILALTAASVLSACAVKCIARKKKDDSDEE
ncbi:MAG: Cna B-type domain-containing protein [Ruminococcaceae bacterium]|nr:Cna B-type domain-containing protein [Oscillospiraceae bacterium]